MPAQCAGGSGRAQIAVLAPHPSAFCAAVGLSEPSHGLFSASPLHPLPESMDQSNREMPKAGVWSEHMTCVLGAVEVVKQRLSSPTRLQPEQAQEVIHKMWLCDAEQTGHPV